MSTDTPFGGLDLEPGWVLRIEKCQEDASNVILALYDTRGETEECVERVTKPRDFYNSRQHRGEVANQFRDAVDAAEGSADGDDVKKAAKEKFSHLTDRSDEVEEAFAQKLASETAARVQRETEKVVFKKTPNELIIRVTIDCEATGISDEIEIAPSAFNNDSPTAVENAYFAATADRLSFSAQDWRDIRTHWESIRTLGEDKDISEHEHIAETAAESLDVNVSETSEALRNGAHNAWFQPPEDVRKEKWTADSGVLWVRTTALTEQVKDAGGNHNDLARVKEALEQLEYLNITDRATRNDCAVYAFNPEAMDVNVEALLADDEDEGGVDV